MYCFAFVAKKQLITDFCSFVQLFQGVPAAHKAWQHAAAAGTNTRPALPSAGRTAELHLLKPLELSRAEEIRGRKFICRSPSAQWPIKRLCNIVWVKKIQHASVHAEPRDCTGSQAGKGDAAETENERQATRWVKHTHTVFNSVTEVALSTEMI